MSTVDLSTYKELYLTTSLAQLEKIEKGVSMLSINNADKQALDAVYINAHTLVSKSMLMGYRQIGMVSHEIENLFYAIKQEKIHLSLGLLETLSSAVIGLHEALELIKTSNSESDLSMHIEALQKFSFVENTSV